MNKCSHFSEKKILKKVQTWIVFSAFCFYTSHKGAPVEVSGQLLNYKIISRKDVVALEAVQRRFTRLIPEMRGLSYEERLNSLGLYSLEFRRMRGDQIEVYRMIKGMDKVDVERMLPLVGHSRTRGHSLRIRGSKFKTELRRNYSPKGL